MPRTPKGAGKQKSAGVADIGIIDSSTSTSSSQGTPRRRSPRCLASDIPALPPPARARRSDRGGGGGGGVSKVRSRRVRGVEQDWPRISVWGCCGSLNIGWQRYVRPDMMIAGDFCGVLRATSVRRSCCVRTSTSTFLVSPVLQLGHCSSSPPCCRCFPLRPPRITTELSLAPGNAVI